MFLIKRVKSNETVTGFYFDIMKDALQKTGKQTKCGYAWNDLDYKKGDIYVVATATDAFRLILLGRPYILWCQGIWPEESYMNHNSMIRFKITSFIEKNAIKNAKILFFVSSQMRQHYINKYKLDIDDNYYIMPCVNDTFHEESFKINLKRKPRIFCYAGALSKWQCINETLELYKKIEDKYSDSKLLLLVKDKNKVEELANLHNIKNYEIDFVSIEELPNRLKGVDFGFLLRKADPVNTVATPTKLMTYIGNGIIPIYSNALHSITDILESTDFKVCYNNDNNIDEIEEFMRNTIDYQILKNEYRDIYIAYFNKERRIDEISKFFTTKF